MPPAPEASLIPQFLHNDTGRYAVPPERIAEQFGAIVGKIHAALPRTRSM
jgi:hypothetical protein